MILEVASLVKEEYRVTSPFCTDTYLMSACSTLLKKMNQLLEVIGALRSHEL